MLLADQIRQYVLATYVEPARAARLSQVTFVSGDIQKALKFTMRYPAVCGAIDAYKFQQENAVVLLKRTGPDQGATAEWTFRI
jgi:hypothetical protein